MRKLLLLLAAGLSFNYSFSQCSIYPVTLSQRVASSSLIVEGRVISTEGFWDSDGKRIYTANTIEVFKVFKGSFTGNTVLLVTDGGRVGQTMLQVSPALELSEGETGMFLLTQSTVKMPAGISSISSYRMKAYADQQGFVKYDVLDLTATDIFNKYPSLGALYQNVQNLTGTAPRDIKSSGLGLSAPGNNDFVALATPVISSVSPLIVAAGIDTVISIRGSNFESARGTGMVQFRYGDDGGSSYFTPDTSNYVLWSDTLIRMKVPTKAGTGKIRVTNSSASNTVAADTLKVLFSQLNVNYLGGSYKPAHRDMNTGGGYTWRIHPRFKNNPDRLKAFYRALDSWRCGTAMNWTVGDTTIIDDITSEGTCVVRIDALDPGKLGVCYSWWSGCSMGGPFEWYVTELDIEFDSTVNWQYGPGNATGSQYDFESVAAHELGHGHQLGHVINSSEIMHFSIANGQNKRSLSSNDLLGGNYIKIQSLRGAFCSRNPMQSIPFSTCITSKPTSKFGASVIQACRNQNITITDSSFGSITGYYWDFGPGASPATASTKGPHTVTYSNAGKKEIKLIAYGIAGNDTITKTDYIYVPGKPSKPASIFGDTTPCGRTVLYEINKQSETKIYRWDVTGGVINGSDTNINVLWNGPGVQTLKIRAVNDCDSSDLQSVLVRVKSNKSDITDTTGVKELGDSACLRPVHTYDSRVYGFEQKWIIQDGTFFTGDDTGKIVMVKWGSMGAHSVKMTIYTDCDSFVQNKVVEVTDRPDVNFTMNAVARQVTYTPVGEAKTYNWNFGDGFNSNLKNPVHTYATPGTYNTRLITSNDCGLDTSFNEITVTSIKTLQQVSFTVVPNPVIDIATIKTSANGIGNYEVYDLLGQLIVSGECKMSEFSINASELKPGVYYFRVMTGGEFASGRFSVTR